MLPLPRENVCPIVIQIQNVWNKHQRTTQKTIIMKNMFTSMKQNEFNLNIESLKS